jgi:two-component system, cell cycle response regulator DivK
MGGIDAVISDCINYGNYLKTRPAVLQPRHTCVYSSPWAKLGMRTPTATDVEPLVLIVEDDLSTRVLYREFLNSSGFRTVDAHNGHQALAKAQELHPNAVLTDLAVPGMDGFEFCRALQQSADTRSIPILAVTGHSEYLDEPDRFRQAGISQVLTKPVSPDLIAQELRRLLGERPDRAA